MDFLISLHLFCICLKMFLYFSRSLFYIYYWISDANTAIFWGETTTNLIVQMSTKPDIVVSYIVMNTLA